MLPKLTKYVLDKYYRNFYLNRKYAEIVIGPLILLSHVAKPISILKKETKSVE